MISVGILGCGRIGRVHAEHIMNSKLANLIAVSDGIATVAEDLAKESGADVCTSEEILTNETIDAVIICTPTDTHIDLIEKAIANNKAVLCEKPMDLSSDRIRSFLNAHQDTPYTLMMGFNRRFDPNFASLQARIARGDIGEVESISIISRDPSPPPLSYIQKSGGIFTDMMIHDFDMARFLLNEEPVEVHAVGSALFDKDIAEAKDFDTAAAMLKTQSGKICQISCSRRACYGYDQRVEVFGAKGMLQAENIHNTTVVFSDATGFHSDPLQDFFLERYSAAYEAELDSFFRCLENNSSQTPSGYDALRAQNLSDAAIKSCHSGCAVKIEE